MALTPAGLDPAHHATTAESGMQISLDHHGTTSYKAALLCRFRRFVTRTYASSGLTADG